VVLRAPGAPALHHAPELLVSAWSQEKALERARAAYEYVARILPIDAALAAVGEANRAALEAEERRDLVAHTEALRELCRVDKREAQARRGAA
jgi:hypothetical protein